MQNLFITHKKSTWTAIVAGVLVILIAVLVLFLDWNMLRPMIAGAITARTGRVASIDGDLRVHLFSWTPRAEINGLRLQNPPWADRKLMFEAKQITLSVSIGRLLRGQIVIPQIKLIEPVMYLERDSKGRASWELGSNAGTPNGNKQPSKIPTIQSLIIQDGKLHVADEIRKLRFGGSVVAVEEAGKSDSSAFKIRAKGTLNDKPFKLDANGGPLLDLTPHMPYVFTLKVTAADIKLDTQVTVPKPFDLSVLDVKFVVSGNDLADAYYLTGLALPNTPAYRFAASVQVSGTTYRVDDLSGKLGSSDLAGKVVVEASGARPKLTAKLTSHNLKMIDLAPTLGQPSGDSAASGTSKSGLSGSTAKPAQDATHVKADEPADDGQAGSRDMLFPDADLQVSRVRGMDADVTYSAGAVSMPKLPMKNLSFHLLLDDGVITIDPLSFVLDQGTFSGNVTIDARAAVPVSNIDMRIADVDLAQFKTAKMTQPPLSGTLFGRVKIHGAGSSVHKLAASADGGVSLIVPHGDLNQALAELTGINVTRGLGLLLAKNETKTSIRCGVVDFQAHNGSLAAKTLFVDTTDVLIQGRGAINLDSEALHLALRGDPKKLRLTRVRAPITIKGTLDHPSIGVDPGKLAEQGAVAVALGTLLTPLAAIMAFVDPGLAKNKDCAASMAEAGGPVHD
jgi:AsmA family protein